MSCAHDSDSMRRCGRLFAAFLFIASAQPGAAQPPSLAAQLERYRRGESDAVLRELAAEKDPKRLARAFIRDAGAWIAEGSVSAQQRRFAAATLALELTHARLASDWRVLRETVEWASKELDRGQPSPAERTFVLAVVALGQRARDSAWLTRTDRSAQRGATPQLDRAIGRFPDEPRLRLAKLVVASFGADSDVEARSRQLSFTHGKAGAAMAREALNAAIRDLQTLTRDPEVGADAQARVAHLFANLRDHASALTHAQAAARAARDPATEYVARVLAGRSLVALGRHADAAREYAAALEAVPSGQSASIALAGLALLIGEPARASTLVDSAFDQTGPRDDPWRLFPYGEFIRWPRLIADLRKAML
jgi:tetratricopeptide (TPR) repeat protein